MCAFLSRRRRRSARRAEAARRRAAESDPPRSFGAADPGSLAFVVCYALFYISVVYTLGYGVRALGIPRTTFLGLLCGAIVFMALATPISAALADRFGGSGADDLRGRGDPGRARDAVADGWRRGWRLRFPGAALGVMGLTFAPLGLFLPELFPVAVRYTGAASAYNLGGIPAPRSLRRSRRRSKQGAGSAGSGLHRGRRRDELSGGVQHARDEAQRWLTRPRDRPARCAISLADRLRRLQRCDDGRCRSIRRARKAAGIWRRKARNCSPNSAGLPESSVTASSSSAWLSEEAFPRKPRTRERHGASTVGKSPRWVGWAQFTMK